MTEKNDIFLWEQILAGDEHAFSQLYLFYRPLLLHYGLRLCQDRALAEECMQDLFCELYFYKDQRPFIHNLKAYLFISYRRDLLRKVQNKRKNQSISEAEGNALLAFSQEDFLIEEERTAGKREALAHLLNELTPRQREIIYLRYYNGLDNEEIAEVLNISYQVVHNTIFKAFKRLRERVSANEYPTFF